MFISVIAVGAAAHHGTPPSGGRSMGFAFRGVYSPALSPSASGEANASPQLQK